MKIFLILFLSAAFLCAGEGWAAETPKDEHELTAKENQWIKENPLRSEVKKGVTDKSQSVKE